MYDIRCKVIENEFCEYVNGEYLINRQTPPGFCAAGFVAIWPFVNAMRFAENTAFEDSNGEVTITCPDGWVQFKLSRIRSKKSFEQNK